MSVLGASSDVEKLDLLASALTPQLRSTLMEGLSDPIMRKIAFALSQRIRCPVQLLSCVNGVISHDSAISALPDIMLACIADLASLHKRIIIAVEGDLIGAVVDAMFGASTSDVVIRNELSEMEVRIGKQMIDLTLSGMAEVLGSITPLDWKIVQYETSVGMLAIGDKQDWMISTTGIFETRLGIGSIRMIFPYAALEPFEAGASAQTWLLGPVVVDRHWAANMTQVVANTQVLLTFDIIRMQVPLGLLRRIHAGEVLPVAIMQHAVGHAGGIDLFAADYGQADGVICCRPVDSCNADLPLSSALHPPGMASAPLRGRASAWIREGDALSSAPVVDHLQVTMTVRLGEARITIGSLSTLHIGDLIRLDQVADGPLAIVVGGKRFGRGEIVSAGGGRYGLKIVALA